VCWHIISGRTWLVQQKSNDSDHIEAILEAGDIVFLPSGAKHD
jgi:ribosomal protein L16 Arg81 hydroxylase